MNQTLNDLTLTGRIIFSDGSIFDSASANNFANVSGFSRNMITGTTSILQDKMIINNEISCASRIECPQLSFRTLEFINDLDIDGLPIQQTQAFSVHLRDLLEAAHEGTNFLSSIFTTSPPSMRWQDNGIDLSVSATSGFSLTSLDYSFETHLSPGCLNIFSSYPSESMTVDMNHLHFYSPQQVTELAISSSRYYQDNPEFNISLGFGVTPNGMSGLSVIGKNKNQCAELSYDRVVFTDDSGPISVLSIDNLTFTNGGDNTTITAGSITTNILNYGILNPPLQTTKINATSTNASVPHNILLQVRTGIGEKTVYVDDISGPLTYDPYLSKLSCRSVCARNVSNTMDLLFGSSTSYPFIGWTSDCDRFTSGLALTVNTLYLSAFSYVASQTIQGVCIYIIAPNPTASIYIGIYNSAGSLLKATAQTNINNITGKVNIPLTSSFTSTDNSIYWIGVIVDKTVSLLGMTNMIMSPSPIAGGSLNGLHATVPMGSFIIPSNNTTTATNSGIHIWGAVW